MARRKTLTMSWPARMLPTIRRAGRFSHQDRHFDVVYCQTHTNALHLYDYACAMRIDEREVSIDPGDLTLSPLNVQTSYDLRAPGHHLCVHFIEDDAAQPGRAIQLPLHVRPGAMQQTLTAQMLSVIRWHRLAGEHPAAAAAAAAALQQLLMSLPMVHHTPVATQQGSDRATDQAGEFLERRLNQTISVPQLAKIVDLSQNYLARCFRRRFGMTIPRYLLTRRIEYAGELLVSTDLSIKQIADRVGLPDPHHFNKQFRRLTGVSPSRYRDRGRT